VDCAESTLHLSGSTVFAPVLLEAAARYVKTCPDARIPVTEHVQGQRGRPRLPGDGGRKGRERHGGTRRTAGVQRRPEERRPSAAAPRPVAPSLLVPNVLTEYDAQSHPKGRPSDRLSAMSPSKRSRSPLEAAALGAADEGVAQCGGDVQGPAGLPDRDQQPASRSFAVCWLTEEVQTARLPASAPVLRAVQAATRTAARTGPISAPRRSSIVELTPDGRKLVDGALKVFEDELELRIGSVIPEQSVREVTAVLSTLRAAGRALDAERKATGQTPVPGMRAPKQPGRPTS
jgi:hypothetical protein